MTRLLDDRHNVDRMSVRRAAQRQTLARDQHMTGTVREGIVNAFFQRIDHQNHLNTHRLVVAHILTCRVPAIER
jgi:hypothetical protein